MKIIKKEKKGMLLASETLKIIIAVICLSFLVYLVGRIYFSNVNNQAKIEAQKTLTTMKEIYPKLNSTNPSHPVYGLSAKGWTIFSFSDTDPKPDVCAGQDCICLCDTVTFDVFNAQLKKCTENNVCYTSKMILSEPSIYIKKDGTTNIELFKSGNWYGVRKK